MESQLNVKKNCQKQKRVVGFNIVRFNLYFGEYDAQGTIVLISQVPRAMIIFAEEIEREKTLIFKRNKTT